MLAAAAVTLGLAALLGLAPAAVAADLGIHQDTGDQNPCRRCHSSVKSDPVLRAWAGSTSGPTSGWGGKDISALCYFCHDATGGPLTNKGHNMTDVAYTDGSHAYATTDVPRRPEGTVESGLANSHLPYVMKAELECTSCHNVHLGSFRPFNQRTAFQDLCGACHPGRLGNGGSSDHRFKSGSVRSYSTHPTRKALADTDRANIKAKADIHDNLKTAINAAPNYSVGGHLNTDDTFDCQTCHAVHGVATGLGSYLTGIDNLLSLDNTNTDGGTNPSQLCEGCHYGGNAGQQVGTVVADGTTIVYADHPLDSQNGRTGFYPTGVLVPDGTHVSAVWTGTGPNRDSGAQGFYGAADGSAPVCSSCHDIHGGIAGTPLLRGPSVTLTGQSTWTFDYDEWCFVCHASAEIIPNGHHSAKNNWATSQLSCGDCHGTEAMGREWKAHNGFWAFEVVVAETSSAFCLGCHDADNPVVVDTTGLKGISGSLVTPALMPATHGQVRGAASHYLGADGDNYDGVAPKTTAWSTTGYFSSYGAPNTGGGGDAAPDSAGAIICGSCHNILYNDGRKNPASYTSALTAGWESNLLLEPYEDDPSGLGDGSGTGHRFGSALCLGCHAEAGVHHPLTGDVVDCSATSLRTALTGFAGQTSAPIGGGNAPGTLSYPNVNAMDCDSCHRPHGANDDSTVVAGPHGFKTNNNRSTKHILEVDGSGHKFDAICMECHGR